MNTMLPQSKLAGTNANKSTHEMKWNCSAVSNWL